MIDHIAFKVDSIPKAVKWYSEMVNAKIEYQDETWAMLNVQGVKLALVLPGSHPNHFAIKCKKLDELPCDDDAIKRHRDGSQYIYLADPYGNAIEWIYYPESDDA